VRFSVVTSAFGSMCDPYIPACRNSIKKIYPDCKINVVGKDTKTDDELIKKLCEEVEYVRISPATLKIICWNQGFKMADTEWVFFTDVDIALLKSIDALIEMAEKNNIDFILTHRHGNKQWVNSGVMIVKKNEKTLKFFDEYEKNMLIDIRSNHNDQHTFINLLNRTDEEVKNILSLQPDKIPTFTEKGINFAGIHCDFLNRSKAKTDWFEETYIQHFKAILDTIITKETKDNRYNRFVTHEIFHMPVKDIKNINLRLNIWKSFTPDELSNKVINIVDYYNSTIEDYASAYNNLIENQDDKNAPKEFQNKILKLYSDYYETKRASRNDN